MSSLKQNHSRKLITYAALALMCFAVLAFLVPADPVVSESRTQRAVHASDSTAQQQQPKAAAPHAKDPSGQERPSSLSQSQITFEKLPRAKSILRDLANSKNYKKTYEEAKLAPEDGGLFAARLIGQRCSQSRTAAQQSLKTASLLPHATAVRVQDAGQRLQLLCGALISSDLDLQADLGALLTGAGRNRDPLLTLESQYVAANATGDRGKIIAALAEILSQPTPDLFLNSLLPPKNGGIYFDGTVYSLGSSGTGVLLDAAKLLVACSVWGRCGGQEDYYVLRNCAFEGICSESYDAQVQEILGNEERVARARAIAASMTEAINSRNLSKFVP